MSIHLRARAGRGGGGDDATGLQLYPKAKKKLPPPPPPTRYDGMQGFMLYTLQSGGSRNGAFLSEEAQCGVPLGRAHLLGTLDDMLGKAPDTGFYLHRGPFMSERNLE